MTAEIQKNAVQSHIDQMWHMGDMSQVDQFCSPNLIYHDPASRSVMNLDLYIDYIKTVRIAFPDLQYTVHDMVTDGDKVLVRWSFEGTQKGSISGIAATGRRVCFTGMSLYSVEDGKISEAWTNWDTYSYLKQLDIIQMPERVKGGMRMEGKA